MSFFKKLNNLDTKRDFISLKDKRFLQMGTDIDGEAVGDRSGTLVSMNAAGNRVAVGGPYNGPTGNKAGHVRVYSWNVTVWTQLGGDIDGEAASDRFGTSVSMNAAGDRVAIGAPLNDVGGTKVDGGHVRVFSWNGTAWTQLGVDIDAEAAGDNFGTSVSMNAAGDRVAIGAPYNDIGGTKVDGGHVRVFSWNGTAWTQLGTDIDGEAAGDSFGTSVSMNAVGDRVAIGGPNNDVGGTKVDGGHARVFSWNGTAWTQLGTDIDGQFELDSFGSVSMNAAGDRVAIGAKWNTGKTGINTGDVRVFIWNGTAWTQLGTDIDGEAGSDQFGTSVSMNAAGDRVAIGAPFNDANGSSAGHTRVYYDYTTSGPIRQTEVSKLAQNINGDITNDNSGWSVSMNAVGDRVAIGSPYYFASRGSVRVRSLDSTTWMRLGAENIGGEADGDNSGWSVSMNAVGDRMAIGAPYNDVGGAKSSAGHVRILSWNGTAWTQLGTDIDGEYAGDTFGASVSMNAAGDRVAIGGPSNDAKLDGGHVRVFSWDGAAWTQLGVDIDSEAAGDAFGTSVSMNAAGDRVAIGAPYNDIGIRTNAGHVRVFSWNGTVWTQLGTDIDGEAASDNFGTSVSMNAAGDRVAIGGPYNDVGGAKVNGGHVRVFSWDGAAWTQLGVDIDAEAASDFFGCSVSMNAVGDRVAIGARQNSGNGSAAGHVRVFNWNGTAWAQLGTDIDGEAAQDNSGWSVSMNAVGDRVAIGAPYNSANGGNSGTVRIFQVGLLQ